jgi:small subunit ribosomal protein S6
MQARVDRVASIIAAHDGEITKRDHWGMRRLAYQIDHQDRGNYMLLKLKCQGAAVAELDRSFRQDDLCLRHLIVRDDEWEERNRAAMAKRRASAAEPDEMAEADDAE